MTATIGFTGDIMSHFGFVIQEVEGHPFDSFFSEPVRQLCQSQDEMWGNLEGPASTVEDGLAIYSEMTRSCYRCPKLFFPRHYISTLKALNFRVLGVANNHSFDFETPHDTLSTAEIVKGYGIETPGLCFDPVIREIGGLSFAVIAFTTFLNPPGGRSVALLTQASAPFLVRTVAHWSRRVDYVVLIAHWGCDYQARPPRVVRCLAGELLQAGAAVIYGNHPHILWPIVQPNPRQLVCYSMGNFSQVFGCSRATRNVYPYTKALYGGFLSVEFTRERIRPLFYPLLTRHNFQAWLRALGLTRSYWEWTPDDSRHWASSVESRHDRLFSQVTRNGAPRPVPIRQRDIEAFYRCAARAGERCVRSDDVPSNRPVDDDRCERTSRGSIEA